MREEAVPSIEARVNRFSTISSISGAAGSFFTTAGLELGQYAADMVADGFRADDQLPGDVAIIVIAG